MQQKTAETAGRERRRAKRTGGCAFAVALCAVFTLALCACGTPAPGAAEPAVSAAPDAAAETEEFPPAPPLESMAPNVPGAPDEIRDFYFSYSDASGGCIFSLWREEDGTGCISATGTNGNPLELMGTVDLSVFERLQEIVEANGIAAWDGFSGGDADAEADGARFSLSVTYGDGGSIDAAGCKRFPEGYEQGAKALSDYLESLAD